MIDRKKEKKWKDIERNTIKYMLRKEKVREMWEVRKELLKKKKEFPTLKTNGLKLKNKMHREWKTKKELMNKKYWTIKIMH